MMTFSPSTDAADNVFLPPGGGDLLDPANWSNGVAPTGFSTWGFIDDAGPQNLTIGADGPEIIVAWRGANIDANFDLEGHSIPVNLIAGFPGIPSFPVPNTARFDFRNGQFLNGGLFPYYGPLYLTSSKSFDAELHQFKWQGEMKSSADVGSVLIDDESSIESIWLTGKTQNVEIKGHSTVTGNGTRDQVFRLDGTESVSLVVDEGSSLGPGLYRLNTRFTENDPKYAAELIIRGGSTTSDIELRISPISTILIEGEGTHADFKNLNLAAGFRGTPHDLLSTTTIRGKATVTVHGPPPVQDGQLPGTFNFQLGKLYIEGEGTHFESNGYSGVAYDLRVTEGATAASDQSIIVLSNALVDHSQFQGSLKSDLYISELYGAGTTAPTVTIDHGEVHGNINGFKSLELREGIVAGNVNVNKVIGSGLIDGDVTPINSIGDIEIHPEGHLEVTGNLAFSGLYFEIFSRDYFGTLEVGTSLLGRANWDLVNSVYHPQYDFGVANHITFDDNFFASVGDRFVLLHYTGGSIEFDALHRFNPAIIADESFQRDLLNITIDNLPDGYQIDVFVENNDIGFRVVEVPEVQTTLLVGIGLLSLIVFHRNKRLSATP
ncbi:polymer-forming cytoskeletal protein [bacterium]|nr:polymer-forming cytoskeletal protein [bacterium]